MNYADFIGRKTQSERGDGPTGCDLPSCLFDYQEYLVRWALEQGRSAIFADCGLGKTPMLLAWADAICRHTNGNVLVLTPIAVAAQMVRESVKFGIEAKRSYVGEVHHGITITNYERLHHFNPDDFVGVVCDESSILKNFNGVRKGEITSFMRKVRYRLLDTATAAPNDFVELGTSSEALGYLGYMDMLNRFFKNDLNNSTNKRMRGKIIKWRLKGHAELPFWRWVTSWARAMRKPSDLGFDDSRLVLPPLSQSEHIVEANTLAPGMLFALPAVGMKEQREERRRTIVERCERMASLVNGTGQSALVWCHLNDEGKELERMIPGCVQVSGSDSDEAREEKFNAFADGEARVLITKPKIGAWGLNFQHCAHVAMFPSHSYEQYYQSIRRCWRFGQERPVHVDIVTTEGESGVLKNMLRKSAQADDMFANLVAEMNSAAGVEIKTNFKNKEVIPSWL